MEELAPTPVTQLLRLLPAIYQETDGRLGDGSAAGSELDKFLRPYDEILFTGGQALAIIVGKLHYACDPEWTKKDFLPWLGGWVASEILEPLTVERRRRLIGRLLSLYPIRGTRAYLEQLLNICVTVPAEVSDGEWAFQVGRYSRVGADTYLGGTPPHFFRVVLRPTADLVVELGKQIRLARKIIDLAKPAHTFYELEIDGPRFQIELHSRVGVDTLL